MGERSNRIERNIEQTRAALGSNLQELEHKVQDATDWRQQFQKNPMTMIGVAFGGGVLLSTLMGGHHGRSYTRRARQGRAVVGYEAGEHETGKAINSQLQRASDTWDTIKGALIGVAAGQVQNFLRETVPGFTDEFRKVQKREHPELAAENPARRPASEPWG